MARFPRHIQSTAFSFEIEGNKAGLINYQLSVIPYPLVIYLYSFGNRLQKYYILLLFGSQTNLLNKWLALSTQQSVELFFLLARRGFKP